MTIDCAHEVVGVTCSRPASWNDKAFVLLDPLLTKIKDGSAPENFELVLKEHDKDGNIVGITRKGVWIIVDNVRLPWSRTIPPLKYGLACEIIRF